MGKTKNSATEKIIGAVVAGAVVGVALGILFAPNKGSETREKLMESNKKLKPQLNNKPMENRKASITEFKRPLINTMIYD